jgi:hypothetical protein
MENMQLETRLKKRNFVKIMDAARTMHAEVDNKT